MLMVLGYHILVIIGEFFASVITAMQQRTVYQLTANDEYASAIPVDTRRAMGYDRADVRMHYDHVEERNREFNTLVKLRNRTHNLIDDRVRDGAHDAY
jgi:hypothetical protein